MSDNPDNSGDNDSSESPADRLTPDEGEAGNTGLVGDSEASGGTGPRPGEDAGFGAAQDDKRPGDGPDVKN